MVYIGVDLGGTNIAIGIVNEQFEIIKKGSTPTLPERGGDAIIEDMAALSKKLLAECGLTLDDVAYAGVATPGTANSETGVVEYSNNIPFLHFPMAEKLSKLLDGKPVHIENDANAAAKAEAVAGVAKGVPYSVMITLGTGLGGGIIIDNKVYSGFNFAGAELGHTVIEKGGRPCTCGRKGCWESYSSTNALIRMCREEMAKDKNSALWRLCGGDEGKVSGRTVFAAVAEGDAAAKAALKVFIDYLACGIASVINIFQPEVLCIGGGISAQEEYLIKPLKKAVESETYGMGGGKRTEIRAARLLNDAGIIGAAALGDIYK
jgi:glucokinase